MKLLAMQSQAAPIPDEAIQKNPEISWPRMSENGDDTVRRVCMFLRVFLLTRGYEK